MLQHYYICAMFNSCTRRRPQNAGHFVPVAITLLLALLMQTAFLHAQSNNRANYQLLWRIDGPGLHAPSYLFGTMHLTDRRVFEFSDSVLTALRNASAFAMEVDMDSMLAYMLSPGGPLQDTVNHMRHLLNNEEYHYVDSLVREKTGSPLEQLKLKRLWFLEKLLVDEEGELNKNAGPNQKPENIFLDGWLHQKATRLNKPVHSLERVQNQLGVMSANVSDAQKEIFLWSIGYQPSGKADAKDRTDRLEARVTHLNELADLYYEGDLQKISKLVNGWEDPEDGPSLEVRNKEMVSNLVSMLNKNSVFAAVGVAHLPGEKGMLSLLREKGYTVTPVSAKFTGETRRQRQQLDSLKGYSLNRMANGYSIVLPGVPVVYPLPGVNGKMFVGGNDVEAGFAFSMDIPQLGTDRRQLVQSMIANMAAQDDAVLQKSYPITYRNIAGTEAILLQKNLPFYVRVFIINNRAFLFMHSSEIADSSNRKDFFRSVRFYDIVRSETRYDTLYQPQLGFSVFLPSEHNHLNIGNKKGMRPEEVYSALDNAHNISYVLRVEKMQRGYYNTDDKQVLKDLRTSILQQDSTLQLTDSVLTEKNGLPQYQLTYQHNNGFISRLHYIPRGNLAYCLLTTYDAAHTDSSYWQHFLHGFHILPLQPHAPIVTFAPADSSFTVAGPDKFTGGPLEHQYGASFVDGNYYTSMDSASLSTYLIEIEKYAPYYHNKPDSLLKTYIHSIDTTFVVMGSRKYSQDGLSVYEVDLKHRNTGLRFYRKAVIAGHTIYRLSAIVPEELAATGYAQQYFASFHPGSRERVDTLHLQQKKLSMLLKDLQSSDTSVFYQASDYLNNLHPDSSDIGPIISALNKPFPADTGASNAKVRLLLSLENATGDTVVHAAEKLFATTESIKQRKNILRFINSIPSDSAVLTFLRLAPELPANTPFPRNIFAFSFRNDSLYEKYLPAMINLASRSETFLYAFTAYTSDDSLWYAPRFSQYKPERLLPGTTQLFKQQLQKWKTRQADSDSSWYWENDLLYTGRILALPGMPASATESFRELLADTTMSLCALGARGLISRGIKVNDKILRNILSDYSAGYSFIGELKQQKQLAYIRPLLTQELLGRSYIANYLTDDYTVTAIEQVSRVKVQPTVSLILYRFKTDGSDDWEYVLNGPYSVDPAKINFEPVFMYWMEGKNIVDKTKLNAVATKAYREYLEEREE
ncbi:TraB/GumN family protein [Chitinophaga sp. RCC_12]|uniref:TraB/GumN family protein n=1 Tax=Chitinophaga sp. RCC_12 TaxID=3239226 RepID=UPI0035263324